MTFLLTGKSSAPSCHGDGAAEDAPAGSPVVAMVGAPNSGKSTLFNAMTGGGRVVGNWPGTTVETGHGVCRAGGTTVSVLDLPGAYSLDGQSPDEFLTRELLLEQPDCERPQVTIVVADASHLARSLYLLAQLRESTMRLIVALTMNDVASRRGSHVDPAVLQAELGAPVVMIDPRRRTGVDQLGVAITEALRAPVAAPRSRTMTVDQDDELAVADERFTWIDRAVTAGCRADRAGRRTVTDRVDRWVTAPFVGPVIFLTVMWAVFELTTAVAAPVQDLLGSFFAGPVTSGADDLLSAVGLGGSWIQLFVTNGLIAGVGMLLTFVPLMAIMFVLLALLEDSGYMARAAVVTDRVMRAIGLPGKAFLPLVVGFGCNVPAISATRILPQARQRIMTALLVPFTSCSARLTVYVMIAATFFPQHSGTVVFGMYLLSIVLIVLVGLAMRATLWRSMGGEPLMLDLPAYQRPTMRVTVAVTWMRVKGFLHTAGGIIVTTVTIVWLLQAIPVHGSAAFGHVAPVDSLFATVCQWIAPVFAPLGFGDWHTAGALVVGFVAKEAVITSWAQTYATGSGGGQTPAQLHEHLHTAFAASSGGATTVAVLAFLVFLLAYTPCVATVAAQIREIGRRWTAFGILLQVGTAWLLGCVVFQVGRLLL